MQSDQVETYCFVDPSVGGLDGVAEGEEDGEDEPPPRPWARLVSLSPRVAPQDLLLEPGQEKGQGGKVDARLGLYSLGRSNKCSLVFKQKLISNEHCRLYCLRNADQELCPYIEDNSANGTYVNKTTRLMKGWCVCSLFAVFCCSFSLVVIPLAGVRRVLHNGDLVSLVNPDTSRQGGAATAGDVEAASFFVQVCLSSSGQTRNGSSGLISSMLTGGAGVGGGGAQEHMRSATVTHLLGQQRNIFDYYDQKELLGAGANGQVFRCVHKVDGHECAVKVSG